MSRPGPLVHAEHEARDEALLRGDDITDGRDELAEVAREIECDGCAVCRAIQRERERLWG